MKAKKLFAALLAITFVVGCTKARKAKFADEETAGAMYAVAELQNVKVQATTEDANQVSAQALETNRVKIAKTNGSARLNALLVGLEITGKPSTQYNLLLTIASDAVTIYKVVQNEKELSSIERQSAYRNKGEFFAPIAQIKVNGYGVIERDKNANGERTSTLVLKSTPFAQASHVKLDTNLDNVMKVDSEYANLIRVHDIKGKEFLFRRTFAKASSTFIVAPGQSGDMEIVKLDLKKDRISVRKVLHLKGANTNDSSKEEIMSVSAQYFKRSGSGSVPSKLVETNVEQAEYVQVNWNSERSSYTSPLNGIKNGCFADQTTMVDAMDNRMDEGVLSFSKVTTATVTADCATGMWRTGGYVDTVQQRNFEFSERISFRIFDKSQMASPTADIPYEVQKILGFGVFTTAIKTPNKYGNTDMIGQERALPSLFDFSKGKVVRFVLGGLDDLSGQDEEIRQVIIDGAKEVIADWNRTLKYAFHGSDLQRDGDYVQLLVEGIDIKKGELGDLDRNYIWNYMDAFDSNIAGLSQAAPNPLTGRVEQTNVLMYPGGLISIIGLMKERHKVIQDYEKFKLASAQQNQPAPETLPAGCGDKCSNVSEAEIDEYKHNIGFAKTAANSLRSGKTIAMSKSQVQASLRNSTAISSAVRKNALGKATSEMFLSRIMQRATLERATTNAARMSAIVAEEILKAAKSGEIGELSERDIKMVEFQAKADALKLAFKEELKNTNGCLMERSEVSSDSSAFIEQDLKVVLKNMYKWTLAHELGHSFGLTHNFKGSFDKANFKFVADEKTNREYSTVMDYIDDSKVMYAGLGPYDAHAIRAAYTGRIQLANGQIVALEDIKKALKLDSWWKLDGNKFNQAALKKYAYCNDFDLGGDPACAQHDLGTTYAALVTEKINNYKLNYPWSNNRGNRIEPLADMYTYIQRLRQTMIGIRVFSDELIYNVITSRDQIPDLLCAYRKSKNFFMQVIGTPTTNMSFDNPGRFAFHEFEAPKLDESGCVPVLNNGELVIEKKKVIVEAKPLESRMSTHMDGIVQRGSAPEKVFAMLMLAQRGLGVERYSTQSIEASIADVEQMFFKGKDVDSNQVLMLLNSQLTGQPAPIYADGIILTDLPAQFEVDQNSLTRSYALLASGMMLDTDSSQSSSNLATHFRVGGTKQILSTGSRTIVALKDQKFDNPDILKFYALTGASAAQKLVDMAASRRLLMDNETQFREIILEGVAAIRAKDEAAFGQAKEKLAAKITELNSTNLLIPEKLKANGLGEKELAGFVLGKVGQLVTVVDTVAPQIKTEEQLGQALAGAEELTASNKEMMMGPLPIMGLINGALSSQLPEPENVDSEDQEAVAKELQRQVSLAIINTLMPANVIESQHDLIVLNLTQLNQMFNMSHPELNK